MEIECPVNASRCFKNGEDVIKALGMNKVINFNSLTRKIGYIFYQGQLLIGFYFTWMYYFSV